MRRLCLILLLVLPVAAAAQSDDRGFIQGLLEDALSAEGRTVQVEGFAGALSSQATIDRITVSDPEGIWLTVEDVVMTWSRAALLRRRIEIDEIAVGRIALPRGPVPVAGLPPAEAAPPFQLPELPVSVRLDTLDIARAEIGAALLGEDAVFSVAGNAELADGDGTAALQIDRLDRPAALTLEARFENATRALSVDLDLDEPQGGLLADALGLADGASVALSLEGDGELDDAFDATLGLRTEGADRLSGTLTLAVDDAGDRGFDLAVSGDIAPLLAPDYRDFLGDQIALNATGTRLADTTLVLDALTLEAAALALNGSARIGADGWPERFALDGRIAPPAGDSVLLPIPGTPTRVGAVALTAGFDAAQGDAWTLGADLTAFERDDLALDTARLDGSGRIDRAGDAVTGRLRVDTQTLRLADPALAAAVGETLSGALRFAWQAGAPLRLSEIDIGGTDYGATGAVQIGPAPEGLGVEIVPDLSVRAGSLARFAPLTGLDLNGAASLAVTGRVEPVRGIVDLQLDGQTEDLATGIAQLDPLIAGPGTLQAGLMRDEAGTRLAPLRLRTNDITLDGTARVGGTDGAASLTARLARTELALPALRGPTRLRLTATQTGAETWDVALGADAPESTRLAFDGAVDLGAADGPAVDGDLDAALGRLAAFADLAGRPLQGAVRLQATGRGRLGAPAFDVDATLVTEDLGVGIAQADRLLRGTTRLSAGAALDADGTIRLRDLQLDNDALSASASGRLAEADSTLTLRAALTDLGIIAPGITGPAQVDISADQRAAQTWDVTLDGSAPGDTTLGFDGAVDLGAAGGPAVDGRLDAAVGRIAAFSRLAGRQLAGSVTLQATGTGRIGAPAFDAAAVIEAQDLRLGDATLDRLVRGTTRLTADAALDEAGTLSLRAVELDGQSLSASLSGQVTETTANLTLDAGLSQLALLAPQFPGPVSVSGTANSDGGPWRIDLRGTGPGGIGLTTAGTVARDAGSVSLSVDGTAPLALANPFIAPRTLDGTVSVDLSVDGPPALSSVRGTVSGSGARLALPALRIAVNDIALNAALANSQAALEVTGALSSGGAVRVTGPIGLTAPFPADLAITLRDGRLQDGRFYDTTAEAEIGLTGPLTGGARLDGTVTLGETEIRIPQVGPSYTVLEGLRHVDPSADVLRTLAFAGIERDATAATPQPAGNRGLPIDLTIEAPNRIFVRGRGLDAELGGTLRLTGTTGNLVPQGQFDLVRGRLDLLGQRLALDEAFVGLRGSFDPVLRFVARTVAGDVEIAIILSGTASALELEVTSSPELPQDEALSLLLFGRDASQLSALQAIQLANAVRTLSGRGTAISEQLRAGLGVDDFDLTTDAEGNAEARVGAYLSENVYTDVTVDSEGESRINLNLDLTDGVTVRGRVGSDGNSAVGIFFERDY